MKTLFLFLSKRLIFSIALIASFYSFSSSQDRTTSVTPEGIIRTDFQLGSIHEDAGQLLTPDVWTPIGPIGITGLSLAVDPQNANVIYVGGLSGLYKTTNGGTNWQLTNSQTLNYRVVAIKVHPTNSNIVFVWLQPSSVTTPSTLLRSTDGGANWTEVLKRNWSYTCDIFFDRLNSLKGFTAADSVYSTTDGGITWKSISSNLGVYALAMYTNNSNLLFAKTYTTIYKTTDGGQSWVALTSQPTSLNGARTFGISTTNQNTLYACNVSLTDSVAGFYRSTDGGVSWQRQVTGIAVSKSINKVCIDTSNPGVIYAGGLINGVYRSTNFGDSWTLISSSIADHYVEAMAINASGNFYCLFGSSLYLTTNQGLSWQALNGDLRNVDVFNIILHPSNPNILYVGSVGGAYRTSDGGATWQQLNTGLVDNDLFALSIDPKNPALLYAGTFGGLVYKSTDAGLSWTESSVGLPGMGRGVISKLTVNSKNTSWIWTNQSPFCYQTKDAGASWIPFLVNNQTITEATFDPLRPDTVYAVKNDTLLRTSNGGATWEVRRAGVRLASLVVSPGNPSILYADSSFGGTAKSTDAGLTWRRVDSLSSRDIFVNPGTPSLVYTSTFGYGIRRSTNDGATWNNYNNGLTNLQTFMPRTPIAAAHTLYCATYGSSVFRVDETATYVVAKAILASNFGLSQNYPNPFNPATVIRYQLAANSYVTLKVFDLLGREVATLVNEKKDVGTYMVRFDGSGLTGGVYFYRLKADNFSVTRKLLLVR